MRIAKLNLLIIAFLCILGAQEAFARRSFGFFRIPTGETVVLAQELPDIPELRRNDGTYIDLGYHFTTLSGGEWVGYVGSSESYLKLDEVQLQALLKVGRLNALPPIPEKPALSSLANYFIYFLLALAGFGLLTKLGLIPKRRPRQPRFQPAEMSSHDNTTSEPSSALLAKMMEAASKHQQAVDSSNYTLPAPASRQSGPATFGKRN